MTKFILNVTRGQKNTAGAKAKEDVVNIMTRDGYVPINFSVRDNKWLRLIASKHDWKLALEQVNERDAIVFQYPLYSRFAGDTLFKYVHTHYQHLKMVAVLHDVESLRKYRDNSTAIKRELDFLNQFDELIVHNDRMKQWLTENGITSEMKSLELFDYLNAEDLVDASLDKPLIFAGNLIKSGFLTRFKIDKPVTVYGISPADSYPENIHYKGVKDADQLPRYLNGCFGLVWDGDQLETNSGVTGEYTRYNNPHKVSLYLSSGLPVIIWQEAALAPFIQEHGVGLVVKSLTNLDEQLANLNPDDYAQMLQNTRELAAKVRAGYFIKKALE